MGKNACEAGLERVLFAIIIERERESTEKLTDREQERPRLGPARRQPWRDSRSDHVGLRIYLLKFESD